jgi:hypothetical protein
MPRPKANSSDDGVLTVPLASKLLNISTPTLRKWFDKGYFIGGYLVPATRERRIPAPLASHVPQNQRHPGPLELAPYVNAYHRRYGHGKQDPRSAF